MKRFVIIICFLFCCTVNYSQFFKNIELGIYYRPGKSNRYNTGHMNGPSWKSKNFYSYGITGQFNVSGKFWLGSGFMINQRSVHWHQVIYYVGSSESIVISFIDKSKSLGIPLSITYRTTLNKNFEFGLSSGFVYDVEFKSNSSLSDKNKKRIYSAFAIDFIYNLNDFLIILLQPNVDLETIDVSNNWNSDMGWRNYDIGLKIGISYIIR